MTRLATFLAALLIAPLAAVAQTTVGAHQVSSGATRLDTLIPYSLLAAGAKGDGTTNDTAAITAALGNANSIVVVPRGRTFMTTGNTVSVAGKTVIFEPGSSLKCIAGASCTALEVSAANVHIVGDSSACIDGNRTNTTSAIGIMVDTGADNFTLENLCIKHFNGTTAAGATIATNGNAIQAHGVQNLVIRGVNFSDTWGDGVRIDGTGASGLVAGFRYENNNCDRSAETVSFAHCVQITFKGDSTKYLLHPVIRGNSATASFATVSTTNPVFVVNGVIDGVISDNHCSGGWYCFSIGNTFNTLISNSVASNFQRAGMEVGNGKNTGVNGVICTRGSATSVKGQNCVIADGQSDFLKIVGCQSASMTGDCVNVTGNQGNVTAFSIDGANTLTVTMSSNNDVQPGTHVKLTQLNVGTYLNGANLLVGTTNAATPGGNSTSFTAPFTHATTGGTVSEPGLTTTVTAFALASDVLTLTTTNSFTAGEVITLTLATNTYLNGKWVINSATGSSIVVSNPSFDAPDASGADTGSAFAPAQYTPWSTNLEIDQTFTQAPAAKAGAIFAQFVQGLTINGGLCDGQGFTATDCIQLQDVLGPVAISGVPAQNADTLVKIKATTAETVDNYTISGVSGVNMAGAWLSASATGAGATFGPNNVFCGGSFSSAGNGCLSNKIPGFTVSTLPTSASAGRATGAQAYVTDATACTAGASPTGGGSTFCTEAWNGAAWVH